ncbi:MAG: hypothetical protein KGM24_11530 [Elusimicrobia bacterium]|nr:hypothetical protein [Elusimicrobiota bacterium]
MAEDRDDAAPAPAPAVGAAESAAFAIMMALAAYLGRGNPDFVYPQILWGFLALLVFNLANFIFLPRRLGPTGRARVSVPINAAMIAAILYWSGGRDSTLWVLNLLPIFTAVLACSGLGTLIATGLALAPLAVFYAPSLRAGDWSGLLELAVKSLTLTAAAAMGARVAAHERRARRSLDEERELARGERLRTRETLSHLDRLATLGTLSASVAHELNGPLAAILGFAEVEGAADPDEAPRTLERVATNAKRCRDIVQNMLGFARRRGAAREPADLNALVRRCVDLKRFDWQGSGLSLDTDYDETLPAIPCSGSEIQQIVFNLLTNAEQALNANGGGRIRVRTVRADAAARVEVEDDGPGIPPDVLKRLGEPFYTTKPAGTGLGISICKKIAADHKGGLRIESAPGRTVFTLELPLTLPPPSSGNC